MNVRRLVTLAVLAAAAVGASDRPAAAQEAAPKPDEHGFLPVTVEPPDAHDCTGKHGGTLTWSTPGEVDTFHPLLANSATSAELKSLVFDSLVAYDNFKWTDRPWLAWKWEHTDDWLTWTFHLRKGVKWSDGAPFTADDVLFTYETTCNPKFPNSDVDNFKVGDAALPTLEKLDDFTVRFHLAAVDVMFLNHVATMSIVPAHVWREAAQGEKPSYATAMGCADPSKVIGTGPFRIQEYKGGERIVYERNPLSWLADKSGARLPYVDRIIVLLVKDMNTQTLKFRNGDFDLIDDIQVSDFDQFREKEKEGAFSLHRLGLHLNTYYIGFNQHPGADKDGKPFVEPYKLAWFQDVRFRRATSHAIDRDNIVKLFMNGKGSAIYGDTTKANKEWYVETTRYTYDPAKASALLDEMGLTRRDTDGVRLDASGKRVEFELATNTENQIRTNIIGQIKADLAKVGVSAVTRTAAIGELINQLSDAHRWEAIVLGWGSSVPPDPLNGQNVLLSSGRLHVWYPQQTKPATPWEAESDRLFAQMAQTPDLAKRKEIWKQIAEIQAQNLGLIYLVAPNCYAASKKRVMNLRPSVLRPSTWWNFEELWLSDGK